MNEPKIVYEATEEVLDKALEKAMARIRENDQFARHDGTMVSFKTACEVLRMSEPTLYRYIQSGLIDAERRGKLYTFDLGYLLRYDRRKARQIFKV